jgi:hypothetical protein
LRVLSKHRVRPAEPPPLVVVANSDEAALFFERDISMIDVARIRLAARIIQAMKTFPSGVVTWRLPDHPVLLKCGAVAFTLRGLVRRIKRCPKERDVKKLLDDVGCLKCKAEFARYRKMTPEMLKRLWEISTLPQRGPYKNEVREFTEQLMRRNLTWRF